MNIDRRLIRLESRLGVMPPVDDDAYGRWRQAAMERFTNEDLFALRDALRKAAASGGSESMESVDALMEGICVRLGIDPPPGTNWGAA